MIKASDYIISNDIYLNSEKLYPLFDSLSDETQDFLYGNQNRYNLSDEKAISNIVDIVSQISKKMKNLSFSFKSYFEYDSYFESIDQINLSKNYQGNKSYHLVKKIFKDCDYDLSVFEFLSSENLNIIEYETNDEKFLNTRMTIKDFIKWFKVDGKLHMSFWLNEIRDKLKVCININELTVSTFIEAWKLHDYQAKNQDRKIIPRSFMKSSIKEKFKIYDYRTALEYIALSKRRAVRYKLPFFDISLHERKPTKFDRTYKHSISTNNSIRTVRNR